MSPTRWSITDINKTLEKFNEMMVGWILLCHNLGDMACLQKDIESSWILVVDIELGTVNTQLTWPAYRSPRVFGDKFGDKVGDKFGDSLNFVINLVTMLVTHFVRHQICHNFWWKFYHYFWWLTKIITLFCDLFGTTFFSKSEVPNLSQFSVLNEK